MSEEHEKFNYVLVEYTAMPPWSEGCMELADKMVARLRRDETLLDAKVILETIETGSAQSTKITIYAQVELSPAPVVEEGDDEPRMYLFTMDGLLDRVLCMKEEDAETYAIRRMSARGDTPSYRAISEDGNSGQMRSIEYGIHPDYNREATIEAMLRRVYPLYSLTDKDAKEGAEQKKEFAIWQKFLSEAKKVRAANPDNSYSYYQWPWPIP